MLLILVSSGVFDALSFVVRFEWVGGLSFIFHNGGGGQSQSYRVSIAPPHL
jgi:hypothetical protein